MAKRRTRQQKIIARLRRRLESNLGQPALPAQIKASFYSPQRSLPRGLLRLDLTRTTIVTILAVIVQIAVAVYLTRYDGWQSVFKILPL